MDHPPSDETILRYLGGKLSAAEAAHVQVFLAADVRRRGVVSGLRTALRAEDIDGHSPDPDIALEAFLQRLHQERTLQRPERSLYHQPSGRTSRRHLRQFFWTVGAVAVTALTVGLMVYKTPQYAAITRTYATQSGQQATVLLTDGTRVTLAPRTTLRLRQFGTMSRAVELDGQAYFEVKQSSTGAPFLVNTGSIVTRVLGTAFLIRRYAQDEQTHIAVAEGRVSITSTTPRQRLALSPVILTSGRVSDLTDSTIVVNTVSDLKPETDWMRGWLVFRHTSVGEVLQTLSHWYGYQFHCSDSAMTHKSVTIAVNAQSSTEALSTLEQVLRVHLTVVGDTVTLTPHQVHSPEKTTRKQAYDVWIPTREVGR